MNEVPFNVAQFLISFEQAQPLRSGHLFIHEIAGGAYLELAVMLNPQIVGNTYSFKTFSGDSVLTAAGVEGYVCTTLKAGDNEIYPAYLSDDYSEPYMDSGLQEEAEYGRRLEVLVATAMTMGLPVNKLTAILDGIHDEDNINFNKVRKDVNFISDMLELRAEEFCHDKDIYITAKPDDRRFQP